MKGREAVREGAVIAAPEDDFHWKIRPAEGGIEKKKSLGVTLLGNRCCLGYST
jgi:hypothetical protein